MSIRLSPKHGVNPAIPLCFYCLKDKNEILLPGMMRGDVEAPRNPVWDRSPCNSCEDLMNKGVILISVDETKSDDKHNPFRTGNFVVIKDSALKRVITDAPILESILQARFAFVPDNVWAALGLPKG